MTLVSRNIRYSRGFHEEGVNCGSGVIENVDIQCIRTLLELLLPFFGILENEANMIIHVQYYLVLRRLSTDCQIRDINDVQ